MAKITKLENEVEIQFFWGETLIASLNKVSRNFSFKDEILTFSKYETLEETIQYFELVKITIFPSLRTQSSVSEFEEYIRFCLNEIQRA